LAADQTPLAECNLLVPAISLVSSEVLLVLLACYSLKPSCVTILHFLALVVA